MRAAVVDIEERAFDVRTEDARPVVVVRHFCADLAQEVVDLFERVGGVGRAERGRADAGQVVHEMRGTAGRQNIHAEASVDVQVDETRGEDRAVRVDGVLAVVVRIQFLDPAVLKADGVKGHKHFAVEQADIFDNGHTIPPNLKSKDIINFFACGRKGRIENFFVF